TPAPTQEPTASPTPAPTKEATPPTDPVAVKGAFANVYWGVDSMAGRLGQPLRPEYVAVSAELDFQRGVIFQRRDGAFRSIYVLSDDGTFQVHDDTWSEADGQFGGEPEEGLYIPSNRFGKIWTEYDLEGQIGYALSDEPVFPIQALIQEFENGHMINSRGIVYVIFGDGSWELYPETDSGTGSGNFQ